MILLSYIEMLEIVGIVVGANVLIAGGGIFLFRKLVTPKEWFSKRYW